MAARDRLVLLGIVVRAHGVQGEVSVRVEDADLGTEIVQSQNRRLWVEQDGAPREERTVESARGTAKGVNLRFEGIADRDAAQKLSGARLFQWRSKLTTVAPDELFTGDLIGLEARTPDGECLGKVGSLGGAGEVLILEIATSSGEELQVPLAKPFIHEIRLEEGLVVLTPPVEPADE
jgi:16S rRNA processing protein RimM